jgi:hypothetical protein
MCGLDACQLEEKMHKKEMQPASAGSRSAGAQRVFAVSMQSGATCVCKWVCTRGQNGRVRLVYGVQAELASALREQVARVKKVGGTNKILHL